MGVNIFGIYLEDDSKNSVNGVVRKNETSDNENYSPYDDLAFIMYVDNAIADIIRKLEAKKQSAIIGKYIQYNTIAISYVRWCDNLQILDERFEYARKLKVACDVLGAGGRVIGGWQLQKRVAAAAEQYERATRRRDAIAIARAHLASVVNLDTILEMNGVSFIERN